MPSGYCTGHTGQWTGHAGQCKQWPQLSEHHDHVRWDMGLWVWPRNEDTVVTVEASDIPKAKRSTAGPQHVNVMLKVFFVSHEVVRHEYAPQGQTITKEVLPGGPSLLSWCCAMQTTGSLGSKILALHHGNAPAHSLHVIQAFLAKHNIPVVCQAPYSPDMAPCDFRLYPKLKMMLKGTRCESREYIMQNTSNQLNTIPKTSFQECFQKWQKRWGKCVHHQGD